MAVALLANAFITKAEAREFFLQNPDTESMKDVDEDTLTRIINGVCSIIEGRTGKFLIVRTAIVEYHDGGDETVVLRHYPVTTVTQVLEDSTALTAATQYDYYPDTGVLYRMTTADDDVAVFTSGRRKVKVTYNAGYGTQTVSGGEVTAIVLPTDPVHARQLEAARLAAMIWTAIIFKEGPANFTNKVAGGSFVPENAIPKVVRDTIQSFTGNYSR